LVVEEEVVLVQDNQHQLQAVLVLEVLVKVVHLLALQELQVKEPVVVMELMLVMVAAAAVVVQV
jgi:hypothetical protein